VALHLVSDGTGKFTPAGGTVVANVTLGTVSDCGAFTGVLNAFLPNDNHILTLKLAAK
jgi:hypothetical protein